MKHRHDLPAVPGSGRPAASWGRFTRARRCRSRLGRSVVDPIAGIPDRPPGATGTFAVDLRPGRYALVCLVVDPDGISHARNGMASELRVA